MDLGQVRGPMTDLDPSKGAYITIKQLASACERTVNQALSSEGIDSSTEASDLDERQKNTSFQGAKCNCAHMFVARD